MALFDTIKKDREKLKGKPFKEKFGYFVDYYKWPVIIVVVVLLWIGGTIYQKRTAPDVCLTGVLFNASDLLAEEQLQQIIDGFCLEQGLEPGKETILLHTDLTYWEENGYEASSYESIQLLSTWILAGEVDFIIADETLMNRLAENGYLLEITDPADDWQLESSYLLDVSGSEVLRGIYGDLGDTLTLGIAVSTQNTQQLLAFIDYLEV